MAFCVMLFVVTLTGGKYGSTVQKTGRFKEGAKRIGRVLVRKG